MTLEIQALINHNQSTHTLQDSKKLQETIERIKLQTCTVLAYAWSYIVTLNHCIKCVFQGLNRVVRMSHEPE